METQVTFRGAPARPSRGQQQAPSVADIELPETMKIAPQVPSRLILLLGVGILVVTAIMPCWDAFRLLNDPTFLLMRSGSSAVLAIVSCLLAPLIYAIMLVLWFKGSRIEFVTEQTLLMIFILVTTCLGFCLLLASQPMLDDGKAFQNDIFYNCADGPYTHDVYQRALALQLLRAEPTCAAKATVRDCAGFKELYASDTHPEYIDYLQSTETRLGCTGFCMTPADVQKAAEAKAAKAKAAAAPADAAEAVPEAVPEVDRPAANGTAANTSAVTSASTFYPGLASPGGFAHPESLLGTWSLGIKGYSKVFVSRTDGGNKSLTIGFPVGFGPFDMIEEVLQPHGKYLVTEIRQKDGKLLGVFRLRKYETLHDSIVTNMKQSHKNGWGPDVLGRKQSPSMLQATYDAFGEISSYDARGETSSAVESRSIRSTRRSRRAQQVVMAAGFQHEAANLGGGTAGIDDNLATPGALNASSMTSSLPPLFRPPGVPSSSQMSCDGAAARTMRHTVDSTGNLFFIEGIVLLIAGVFGGLFKVLGLVVEGYMEEESDFRSAKARFRQAQELML